MISKFVAKLVVWALKSNLKLDDKIFITNKLIEKLALPISGTIQETPDGILINGKYLELEQVIQLRESAKQLLHSQARRLVTEQVKWLAINQGIHLSTSSETILFAKAALWIIKESEDLIIKLAQEETEPTSL